LANRTVSAADNCRYVFLRNLPHSGSQRNEWQRRNMALAFVI
jgi:hypothetical protein